MAVAYTVDGVQSLGNIKLVHGTFTTALGDTGATLTATTHGLNYIVGAQVKIDRGGITAQDPKIAIASGTLTWTVDDTYGYSGAWWVMGR